MQDTSYFYLPSVVPDTTLCSVAVAAPLENAATEHSIREFTFSYTLPSSDYPSGKTRLGSQSEYINLYQGHELKPVHSVPVQKEGLDQNWFFPVFLMVLAVYTWMRIFYNKYFNQLLQAFLNTNLTNQIVRDENILVQRASIILALTFNVIGALFLYLLSLDIGWTLGGIGPGFNRFAFFLTVVSATYTLKFLILKIIGWLFDLDREMATYIFNIFLINNVLGLILLPIVALMAYNPIIETHFLANLSIVLIAFAFFYRIIRGLLAGMSVPGFSPLYLFLYLCTLEIAPLLVLIRIIKP